MSINSAAIDLICEFEGFVDHWYPDPAKGWDVPTCCYGHTDAAGQPLYADSKSRKFTKDEGRVILARDLAAVEAIVRDAVTAPLSDNELGALVSFTFNLGEDNLRKSTLLRLLNSGAPRGDVANEFQRWNRANGKIMAGLTRRRAAEAALFMTGAQEIPVDPAPQPLPHSGGFAIGWIVIGVLVALAFIAIAVSVRF
jgi:lysozyme